MSHAMWRSSSPAGRPRPARRRGMRELAWSTVMTNAERPLLRVSVRADGSSGARNRSLMGFRIPAALSIDFGVAATNLALLHGFERLVFGALEQQVAGEQLSAEPVGGRRCLLEQGQRLGEARRQRAPAARVDLALGPDAVETRLHHGCQREGWICGGVAYAELDIELPGALRGIGAVQRCDSKSRAAIGDADIGVGRCPAGRP